MIKEAIQKTYQSLRKHNNDFFVAFVMLLLMLFFWVTFQVSFFRETERMPGADFVALQANSPIDQTIDCSEENSVSGINILFQTKGKVIEGIINVSLLENNVEISKWSVDSSVLKDNDYKTFELVKPIRLESDSEYAIRIVGEYEGDNEIAIGYDSTGTLCYSYTLRNDQQVNIYLLLGIMLLALSSVVILSRVNPNIIMIGTLAVAIVCYLVVCPNGTAPDEGNHFFRAFEIANGSLLSEHIDETGVGGNVLPTAITQYSDTEAELDWNSTSEIEFCNTALYAPISYLPQSIGISIGQMHTNNVSCLFMCGRAVNALTCLVLCAFALNSIPFGKRMLFIIMMFPMSIQEMASMSPDGLTISLSLFFIAYILKLAYSSDRIRKRDLIIVALSGIAISLLKIVYVVLLLIVFLIPICKYKTKKTGYLYRVSLLSSAGIINLIWLYISSGYLIEFNPGVAPREQVKFVLTNIGDYVFVCVRTMITWIDLWVSYMISARMGALSISTYGFIWIGILVLLIYEASTIRVRVPTRRMDSHLLLFIFLMGSALILTSLYVQWSAFMNPLIYGIQGRYFSPIIALILLSSVIWKNRHTSSRLILPSSSRGDYCFLLMVFFNEIVLLRIAESYI